MLGLPQKAAPVAVEDNPDRKRVLGDVVTITPASPGPTGSALRELALHEGETLESAATARCQQTNGTSQY